MIINTKFDMDQKVYAIAQETVTTKHPCPMCGGAGTIELNVVKATCPHCWGAGETHTSSKRQWRITHVGIIGNVRASLLRFKQNYEYMLDATGIGSGRLWNEHNLYASEGEAQTECNRRNAIVSETRRAYQCDRSHIFTEPGTKLTARQTSDSPEEWSACCPKCGSLDFAEGTQCDYCGEFIPEGEEHEH